MSRLTCSRDRRLIVCKSAQTGLTSCLSSRVRAALEKYAGLNSPKLISAFDRYGMAGMVDFRKFHGRIHEWTSSVFRRLYPFNEIIN
jgi:hypothetical protein